MKHKIYLLIFLKGVFELFLQPQRNINPRDWNVITSFLYCKLTQCIALFRYENDSLRLMFFYILSKSSHWEIFIFSSPLKIIVCSIFFLWVFVLMTFPYPLKYEETIFYCKLNCFCLLRFGLPLFSISFSHSCMHMSMCYLCLCIHTSNNCRICKAQCKMQISALLFKIIKNFKMATEKP